MSVQEIRQLCRCRMAYLGTSHIGWQRQSTAAESKMSSVQACTEGALLRALLALAAALLPNRWSRWLPSAKVNVQAMSRTDAGTHALDQHVHFTLRFGDATGEAGEAGEAADGDLLSVLLLRWNAELPASIRVLSIAAVGPWRSWRRGEHDDGSAAEDEGGAARKRQRAPGSDTAAVAAPALVLPQRLRELRAVQKQYRYFLQQGGGRPHPQHRRHCWFLPRRLDLGALRRALAALEGTHDFRPFSQGKRAQGHGGMAIGVGMAGRRTVTCARLLVFRSGAVLDRCVSIGTMTRAAYGGEGGSGTEAGGDSNGDGGADNGVDGSIGGVQAGANGAGQVMPLHFLCVELTADGFLTHMVRRIIGTLRQVGEGQCSAEAVEEVLAGAREAGPSAPPHALWLNKVWIDEAEWQSARSRLRLSIPAVELS